MIGRMKKTDRAVPAAKSCILRNGRCISRQEREHCGNGREMGEQALSMWATQLLRSATFSGLVSKVS